LVLSLKKEHRPRVFQNKMLRRIFWPKRDKVTGGGENYTIQSLMISTAHPVLFR
jgi:hypothetical protein